MEDWIIHPGSGVVIILNLQVFQQHIFLFQCRRSCSFANDEWWSLVWAHHVNSKHDTKTVLGVPLLLPSDLSRTEKKKDKSNLTGSNSTSRNLTRLWIHTPFHAQMHKSFQVNTCNTEMFHQHCRHLVVHTASAKGSKLLSWTVYSQGNQDFHQWCAWTGHHITCKICVEIHL